MYVINKTDITLQIESGFGLFVVNDFSLEVIFGERSKNQICKEIKETGQAILTPFRILSLELFLQDYWKIKIG